MDPHISWPGGSTAILLSNVPDLVRIEGPHDSLSVIGRAIVNDDDFEILPRYFQSSQAGIELSYTLE
jgi:hypothetical protein